jgi:hypothetical protein
VTVNRVRVSVVIVNHNRVDDLRDALRSVTVQDYPDREIIVVDNASSDASCTMVSREFPEVRLLPLDENRGMDGYSEGFRHASGEIVFQMDNDSLMPSPDLLSKVVGVLDAAPPQVAVLACRVEEYRPGGERIADLEARDRRRGPLEDHGFHSGGVAFRAAVLRQVGAYDRDIFLYGAELFLQVKILAAGYRILFHPELLVLHKSSPVGRDRSRGIYFEVRNRLWFVRAWGTAGQRYRFLPRILLHDLAYGIRRRSLESVRRAVRDGLGRMPSGIFPGPGPFPAQVASLIETVGRDFSLARTIRKVVAGQ